LDDLHTLEENKSARLKKPLERRVFPAGKDSKKRPYEDFRWSRFKHMAPAEMYTVVGEHVFPFLRTLGAHTRRSCGRKTQPPRQHGEARLKPAALLDETTRQETKRGPVSGSEKPPTGPKLGKWPPPKARRGHQGIVSRYRAYF
jgi:hypothetical protein